MLRGEEPQRYTKAPKWLCDYLWLCFEMLQITSFGLDVTVVDVPCGNKRWHGCFYTQGRKNYIELSSCIRNNKYWRRIVVHECLHYKMKSLDKKVESGIISKRLTSAVEEKALKEYCEAVEVYVWSMSDALVEIIDREYQRRRKLTRS